MLESQQLEQITHGRTNQIPSDGVPLMPFYILLVTIIVCSFYVFWMKNKYKKVVQMITEIYENDVESLLLILRHLEKQEKLAGSRNSSSQWKMLYDLTGCSNAFKAYIERMVRDIRENEIREYLEVSLNLAQELTNETLSNNSVINFIDKNRKLIKTVIPIGFVWNELPQPAKTAILKFVSVSVENLQHLIILTGNNGARKVIDGIVKMAKHGKEFSIMLALLPIAFEICRSVYLWFHGRISGKRCAQNIAGVSITTAMGVGGAAIGACVFGILCVTIPVGLPAAIAACAAFGPQVTIAFLTLESMIASVGVPIGTALGGAVGTIVGDALAPMLCKRIFDLPPTQALEDAYEYIGVHHLASDSEIVAAYRRLSLRDHPDKPTGSKEAFCKLTAYVSIIRAARGMEAL